MKKVGLLLQVAVAIVLGILLGKLLPNDAIRVFTTFNSLFGNFLSFAIPLIIFGLVAPSIAGLGKNAKKLVLFTTIIAYLSTLFSGFLTYFSCSLTYPYIVSEGSAAASFAMSQSDLFAPYFTIIMPPIIEVMSALILAFTVGLGLTLIKGETLKNAIVDFKNIIETLISKVIIPLLPLHILGIFMKMTASEQVAEIMETFVKIIILIFILQAVLLLIQFSVAGAVAKKNPLKLLRTMLTAYATALGTQSSAATIPITLQQVKKMGVADDIADFTVPLCATIHLSGSTMKIVACAMAIMIMNSMPINFTDYVGFIFMLGIVMIAAPGVPGGAIMAALGVLGMLNFDENMQGLMIALYIAMDSFGTACNVTGDGFIAVVVNKIAGKKI